MGGGHPSLFTRDIFKSLSVAEENGYSCIPVVIAESWSGDLDALPGGYYVWIRANPNELTRIEPDLATRLNELLTAFRNIV